MDNNFDNTDDEVVDSIPVGAKKIDEPDYIDGRNKQNSYRQYYNNSRSKIIIENGPASIVTKLALLLSFLSVILCIFPQWSFMFALFGVGLSLLSIALHLNGRLIAILAIILGIIGAVLSTLSSIIWTLIYAIIGLF